MKLLLRTSFLSAFLLLALRTSPAAMQQNDIRAMLESAKTELANKNFAGAYETLKKCLKLAPNNAAVLTQLGDTYLANDSTNQAILAYSRAKEADPASVRAYEGLGDSYAKEGATIVAITQYQKVVELDSVDAEAYHKLAHLYMKLRRYNDAAQAFTAVLLRDSTNNEATFELGKLYLSAKRWANAAKTFLTYTQHCPDSVEGWKLSMEAALNARQYNQALEAADHLLKIKVSSASVLRTRGRALAELGRCPAALSSYEQLSRIDTLSADDFYRMGKCNSNLKRDSLSVIFLEKSLALDSSEAEIWGDIGTVYMRLRKFEKAAGAFEQRYKLEPTSTGSYFNYALSSMALERWNDALAALRHALTLNTDYLPIPLNIARCLVRIDSLEASVPYYETVLRLAKEGGSEKFKTESAEALSIIGLRYLSQKKYAQAIEFLKESIKTKGNVAQAHLWLGQAYALSGKRDEAIAEYRMVLRIDPKNKDAHKGLELLGEE